jgi:hypothetical protein
MADICSNPGFETNTTGWDFSAGETLTRVTSEQHSGVASMQVTTNGVTTDEGTWIRPLYVVNVGEQFTTRCWLKGSGVVKIWAATLVGGLYNEWTKSGDITLSGTWQQVSSSHTISATASERVELRVSTTSNLAAQTVTFYIDDAEIIVPDIATGGAARLLMMGVG